MICRTGIYGKDRGEPRQSPTQAKEGLRGARGPRALSLDNAFALIEGQPAMARGLRPRKRH